MKRKPGIGRRGLACCLCDENSHCSGCNSGECPDKGWGENERCSLERGYAHCDSIEKLDMILPALEAKLAEYSIQDLPVLKAALRELSELDQPEMERSSYRLPDKGYRFDDAVSSSILKDYFVSSPAIRDTVRSIVSDLEQLRARREEILEKAELILSAVASGSASTES